jgi:hypothetical protein
VLTFYDDSRHVVRRFSSDDAAPAPIPHLDKPAYWERPFVKLSTTAGMHRFTWDLREAPPSSDQDLPISAVPHDTPRVPQGPLVVPGRYLVSLDVDGHIMESPLEVVMDPRVVISNEALEAQYQLAARLTSLANRSYAAAAKARNNAAMAAFTKINGDAVALLDTVDGADAPPTQQAIAAVSALEQQFDGIERTR